MITHKTCPFCGSCATSKVWMPYDGAHAMVVSGSFRLCVRFLDGSRPVSGRVRSNF